MIFNFLKYVKPVWYFNVKPTVDFGFFPTETTCIQNGFATDRKYISSEARERDVAWTAFQSGFVSDAYKEGINVWETIDFPIEDEYLFLFKNFHKAWVFYVLLIRILTFHNPFKEIKAFLKHRSVPRVDFSINTFNYLDYESFKSDLIQQEPLVSIVIPTLNRYQYLKNVLIDLENQTYKNFEVIIVDQTEPFQEVFYQHWNLDLTYWFQPEKALWKARNEAIQKAKGAYILLYDDDSRVTPNWIEEHLKCLDFFKADLSSGVSLSVVGDAIPKNYSYFKWSDQLDTGNVLLKKEVFYVLGGFNLQFEKQRMGDAEFGMRCYLAGYKNISNYKAKRIHLKVPEGGLRQMGSWDGWRPKKTLGPRPVPSVLYFARKYFGNTLAQYYVLCSSIPSLVPYQLKRYRIIKFLFFIFLPLIFPLVIYQVTTSWKLASKMLENDEIG